MAPECDERITSDDAMKVIADKGNLPVLNASALAPAEGVGKDVYSAYEKHLDSMSTDGAYTDYINGRQNLLYHGIPVVDLRISSYLAKLSSSSPVPKSFCILTDRRNLVLAVNTADFPGNEIRMWYNPDEMENRQRAVFMAGCDVLDEGLVAFASRI